MKTERRHELATNDLADWMGERIEALRPYSTAIWGTVLAVIAVILVVVYTSRKREAQLERTWDSYFSAQRETTPEGLRSVAEAHPRAPAGLWSRLTLADIQLRKGVDGMFSFRAEGEDSLKDAVEAYEYVIANAPRGSLLAERATFGLGEALESQNELKKARAQYETLIETWPEGAFSMQAKQRLVDLEKASTKQFYDWFAKQEPKPKPAASSILSGEKPPFDASKLEEHPFQPQIKLNTGADKKESATKESAEKEPGKEGAKKEEGSEKESGAEESKE